MGVLIALLSGLLFGLGLVVSDMVNPARVLGFLNVASGAWDPTLAFVMGGAMLPMVIAWRFSRPPRRPSHGEAFPPPASRVFDRRLIGGSAIFGLGWGLVGMCPGPALAGLSIGGSPVWIFVAAMAVGFAIAGSVTRSRA